MFRLVKILNGRTNHGEPVRLPCEEKAIDIGSALVIVDGKVNIYDPSYDGNSPPAFISCDSHSIAKGSTAHTVLAIPVSSDMIFEVPITEFPESLKVGAKIALVDGGSVTVTTEGGVGTVWNTCEASAEGDKIQVRFI